MFYTGMQAGAPVERIPMPLTDVVVARGRERFNIYCSPCHGIAGDGDGMIVQARLQAADRRSTIRGCATSAPATSST